MWTFRKHLYLEWRACERFGVLPEGIKPNWSDTSAWHQSLLLAYEQIRQYEEAEEFQILINSRVPSI